ncbi:hypothetical protein DOTSEDRAFT_72153 [Dothistroma septosporum NZE10]|uniref:Uncharacterized protein n=1 Tax=Dothistroma septosporum (strain NZE10 / CBS 128990) TaxID=675120 RepID=N1PME8_DOTSN|nr:hypothetical protein DOTSEDRAFT_72153 [Dothistroma septosporum NZE10]
MAAIFVIARVRHNSISSKSKELVARSFRHNNFIVGYDAKVAMPISDRAGNAVLVDAIMC